MTEVSFSWNLVADVQQMWSLPFMLNAFRAGSLVALIAAVIGVFVVVRRQTFAAHTLSLVGFPGAAGAVWLGLPPAAGYYAACLAGGLVIGARPRRTGRRAGAGYAAESDVIGTVQSVALAFGFLFVALYRGFLNGTNALLFGSFLGITSGQVVVLAAVTVAVLALLAVTGRRLLFASLDPDVAKARGIRVSRVDAGFLLLLAAATAAASQITGALLVFALLVLPAATAQQLTASPTRAMGLAVAIGLAVTWVSLTVAFYTSYPVGFVVTTLSFAGYVIASGARRAIRHCSRDPSRHPSRHPRGHAVGHL